MGLRQGRGARASMSRSSVLMVDAVINLVLGALLIWFPDGLVVFLGVPTDDSGFYPGILGGVLIGIGIALLIECNARSRHGDGLGLGGAVAINLCGGLVLVAWLTFGTFDVAPRGMILMWVLAAILVAISVWELALSRRSEATDGDA